MTRREAAAGITGAMSELYDVFVDWPGRLGREMPGLVRRLEGVGARRVLDVGCGTGRHVEAFLERAFDAYGADASPDMLEKARGLGLDEARLFDWRLGQDPPATLRALRPFDAITCMGNVWPHLVALEELEAAGRAILELLRPGGLLVCGLKAFVVRQQTGDPYLPLLKREHAGRPLFFVRFVDFDVDLPDGGDEGASSCDLHV
jgi:SAM-dependent methyltransferase